MRVLSAEAYGAAVDFLETLGRPLDLALYRCAFLGGNADAVLEALAIFQNSDGGYGHSLEPDALVAESSVLDTTHALQVMARLETPSDHSPLVAAMRYLRETYDQDFGGWPIRPFASPQTVCAPWWKSTDMEAWREDGGGAVKPDDGGAGVFLGSRSAGGPWPDRSDNRGRGALG